MWRISLLKNRRVSRGGEPAVSFLLNLEFSHCLYRTVFPDYVLYIDCLISVIST